MLSVGAIHFKDRFCASRKGGTGGGGEVGETGGGGWVIDCIHSKKAVSAPLGNCLEHLSEQVIPKLVNPTY